jgi:4-amino-4-deoxy-L-arabinose transferase-like glycosyltransferase
MNMSKSEKSAYFCHVFANNFFVCIFLNLFQRTQNQREILRFFIPILNFFFKFFFALISTFLKLWLQMRRKRFKKTENLFLWMCLRI